MNDALLVRVLNGLATPARPFQERPPLQRRQIVRDAEGLFETTFLVE